MIRERFSGDLKEAIKARDALRVSTLRLITAAIKDRDIAARTGDNTDVVPDSKILAILARMSKPRQESARANEAGDPWTSPPASVRRSTSSASFCRGR